MAFGLEQIETGVQVWHGDRDEVVPLHHSTYVAERIPHATLNVVEGTGHLLLLSHTAEITRALIDQALALVGNPGFGDDYTHPRSRARARLAVHGAAPLGFETALLVLDLALQLAQGAAHLAAHRRGRSELRDQAGDPSANHTVGESELDLAAARAMLSDPPAAAVVHACHRVPGHVEGLVPLDHLNQATDLGGPDAEQDPVAGHQARSAFHQPPPSG